VTPVRKLYVTQLSLHGEDGSDTVRREDAEVEALVGDGEEEDGGGGVGPRRGGRAEGREDHTQVALGVERAARGSERGEREGGDILNDQPLHELSKWTTVSHNHNPNTHAPEALQHGFQHHRTLAVAPAPARPTATATAAATTAVADGDDARTHLRPNAQATGTRQGLGDTLTHDDASPTSS